MRLWRVNFRPERANIRPGRANLRPERADLRVYLRLGGGRKISLYGIKEMAGKSSKIPITMLMLDSL